MADRKLSEALKEIRTITSVILTTALLAVATTDAVRSELLRRERAKHLASWLLLRDTFREKAQFLNEAPKSGQIRGFPETIQIQSGTEVETIRPFILQIPWPGETTRTISIERIEPESPAFRIRSPDELLPFDHYAIASIHEKVWILPIRYTQTVRATYDAVLRDKLAVPLGWAAIRAHLYTLGWGGQSPDDLRLNDPYLAKFMGEGFTASYSISGIPISPGYYPAAISLFLGLQAFVLLGPWLVIRNRIIPSQDSSWIMLVSTPESGGRLLRVARVMVGAICVALPLLAVAIQFRLVPYLTYIERAAWLSTVLGPTAAALLLTAVAKRLIFNTTGAEKHSQRRPS
jgi:hypothetical protein